MGDGPKLEYLEKIGQRSKVRDAGDRYEKMQEEAGLLKLPRSSKPVVQGENGATPSNRVVPSTVDRQPRNKEASSPVQPQPVVIGKTPGQKLSDLVQVKKEATKADAARPDQTKDVKLPSAQSAEPKALPKALPSSSSSMRGVEKFLAGLPTENFKQTMWGLKQLLNGKIRTPQTKEELGRLLRELQKSPKLMAQIAQKSPEFLKWLGGANLENKPIFTKTEGSENKKEKSTLNAKTTAVGSAMGPRAAVTDKNTEIQSGVSGGKSDAPSAVEKKEGAGTRFITAVSKTYEGFTKAVEKLYGIVSGGAKRLVMAFIPKKVTTNPFGPTSAERGLGEIPFADRVTGPSGKGIDG